MCRAMQLRAYALIMGVRKDRKVLTTVAVMTRQMYWGLGREGLSRRGWLGGVPVGFRQSNRVLLSQRWMRKGKLRKWS